MDIGVATDAAVDAIDAIKHKWKVTPAEAPSIDAFGLVVGIAALQYVTPDRQKIKDIVFHALDGVYLAVAEDKDPMRVIYSELVELRKERQKLSPSNDIRLDPKDSPGASAPKVTLTRKIIVQAIVDERKRQDEKWGDQSSNTNGKWLAVLIEEVGEAGQAILDEGKTDTTADTGRVTGLVEELIQAAAVIIAWLEHMTPEEIR